MWIFELKGLTISLSLLFLLLLLRGCIPSLITLVSQCTKPGDASYGTINTFSWIFIVNHVIQGKIVPIFLLVFLNNVSLHFLYSVIHNLSVVDLFIVQWSSIEGKTAMARFLYSQTLLIWTLRGLHKVSLLMGCLYLAG